jgi:proteasome accessory factor A
LWERAIDAIDAGNLDAVAREIDWVIRYQLIER